MIIKYIEQLGYEIDGDLTGDINLNEADVRQLVISRSQRITFEYEINNRLFKSIVTHTSDTNTISHNFCYCGCAFEEDCKNYENGYWSNNFTLQDAYCSFMDKAILLSKKGVTV